MVKTAPNCGGVPRHPSVTNHDVVPHCLRSRCKTASEQYRTGTCSGIANGFKCVDQPPCSSGQYLAGFDTTKKGKCTDQPTCTSSQFLASASAVTKGSCADQPVCKSSQYLSVASSTKRGTCLDQPVCRIDEYLVGSDATKKGTCAACTNTVCASSTFRTGKCSGTANNYKCSTCTNIKCAAGSYRTGTCQGTTNEFKCQSCDNAKCKTNEFQAGTCAGTTNNFECKVCDNVNCPSGAFRSGTCMGRTNGFTCTKHGNCPPGKFLSGQSTTSKGTCVDQPVCSSGQYLTSFNTTKKGVCASQPVCPSSTYLAGSSAVTKGSCTSCANANCPSGQFRSGVCGGTANTFVCSACAHITCPAGQQRLGSCAGTGDGFACVACADGQYKNSATSCTPKKQAGACAGGSKFVHGDASDKTRDDTTCAACPDGAFKDSPTTCAAKRSTCAPGSRFVLGDTAVKDKDDTACIPCGPDTYQPDEGSAQRCTSQPTCPKGTRITPDSKTHARNCTACPDGFFQRDGAHRLGSCAAWATCTEGQFVAAEPTASSDRACGRVGDCTEDEYESKAPTPTSGRECRLLSICAKGYHVIRNATVTSDLTCGMCAAGTFQDSERHRLTQCTVQTTCGAGEFASPISKTQARTCSPCPPGMFQDRTRHKELACHPKRNTCPAGARFVAGDDDMVSADDTACEACGDDTFKVAVSNATACTLQPLCGPGELMGPDSKTTERRCISCVVGTYQRSPAHRKLECPPWNKCGRAGQFEASAPNATHDRICGSAGPCFADEYEAAPLTPTSARKCVRLSTCAEGQRVTTPATNTTDIACGSCEPGTFRDLSAHREPKCAPQPELQCPAGQRASPPSVLVATVCAPCSAVLPCARTSTAPPISTPTDRVPTKGTATSKAAGIGASAATVASSAVTDSSVLVGGNSTLMASDQTATAATAAAADEAGDSGGGDSGVLWIVIVAVVGLVLCLVAVVAMLMRRSGKMAGSGIPVVNNVTCHNPAYNASAGDAATFVRDGFVLPRAPEKGYVNDDAVARALVNTPTAWGDGDGGIGSASSSPSYKYEESSVVHQTGSIRMKQPRTGTLYDIPMEAQSNPASAMSPLSLSLSLSLSLPLFLLPFVLLFLLLFFHYRA